MKILRANSGIGVWIGRRVLGGRGRSADLRIGLQVGGWCAIGRVDGVVRRLRLAAGWLPRRLFSTVIKECGLKGFNVRHTIKVEGMADSRQDDTVSHLGEEVVLEIGVVDDGRRGKSCRCVASAFKGNKFRNGNLLLEPGEATWWEMQLLDKDSFVHQAVPVYAGLHIPLPFVEVDVVTGTNEKRHQIGQRRTHLVSIDRQHVAARWIIAQESIGRGIWL